VHKRVAQAKSQTAVRSALDAQKSKLHNKLSEAQAQKQIRDAFNAEVSKELAAAEQALQSARSEADRAAAARNKRAIDAFKTEQELLLLRRLEIEKALDELAKEESKVRNAAANDRLAARQSKATEEKALQRERLQAEQEKLERERSASVAKLMASLPYAVSLQEIQNTSNPDRVSAPTQNSEQAAAISKTYAEFLRVLHAAEATRGDATSHGAADIGSYAESQRKSLGATTVSLHTDVDAARRQEALATLARLRMQEQGLFGKHGFTDKQITSDARFRLASALREQGGAGAQGSYGRTVMMGLARESALNKVSSSIYNSSAGDAR
jgi:hypothetical protein